MKYDEQEDFAGADGTSEHADGNAGAREPLDNYVLDPSDPGFDNSESLEVAREASTEFGQLGSDEEVDDAQYAQQRQEEPTRKPSQLPFYAAMGCLVLAGAGLIGYKTGLLSGLMNRPKAQVASTLDTSGTMPAPAPAPKASGTSSLLGGSKDGAAPVDMFASKPQASDPATPPNGASQVVGPDEFQALTEKPGSDSGAGSSAAAAAAPAAPSAPAMSAAPVAVASAPAVPAAPVTPAVAMAQAPAAAPVVVPAAVAPVVPAAAPAAQPVQVASADALKAQEPVQAKSEQKAPVASRAQRPASAATPVAKAPRASSKPSAQVGRMHAKGGPRRGDAKLAAAGPGKRKSAPMITEMKDDEPVAGWHLEGTYPLYGPGQRAWLRDRDGKLITVAVGDRVNGARVTSIERYGRAVHTTGGTITP